MWVIKKTKFSFSLYYALCSLIQVYVCGLALFKQIKHKFSFKRMQYWINYFRIPKSWPSRFRSKIQNWKTIWAILSLLRPSRKKAPSSPKCRTRTRPWFRTVWPDRQARQAVWGEDSSPDLPIKQEKSNLQVLIKKVQNFFRYVVIFLENTTDTFELRPFFNAV